MSPLKIKSLLVPNEISAVIDPEVKEILLFN